MKNKSRLLLSFLMVAPIAIAGLSFALNNEHKEVIKSAQAALPTQTTRRVFFEIKNTGWSSSSAPYMWVFTQNKAIQTTKIMSINGNDDYLCYIDMSSTDANGGFLLFNGASDCIDAQGNPVWDVINDDNEWRKSVDIASGTIPTWGEGQDVYIIQGQWEQKASASSGNTLTLTSAQMSTLMSFYTTCAKDALYTNGALAYPQLYYNFAIESFINDTTVVSQRSGGEKEGTTLGKKISTMREEYISMGGTVPGDDPEPVHNKKSLRILHCFDWSLDSIRNKLADIKAAGFDAVQTSPLQGAKDYDAGYAQYESSNWWKLYQPISFSMTGYSWIGTSHQLQNLTAAADNYGIKVIVDVVANHFGNSGNDTEQQRNTINSGAYGYEPTIYNNNLRHDYISASDSSIQATVRGNIGMPDLMTEDTRVQARVYSYLNELVGYGVDGFRFDAAKHIETSQDGTYASSFWENTLGRIKIEHQGLFAYGEILNSCGPSSRKFSHYTDYASMDAVTDNQTGNKATDWLNKDWGYPSGDYNTNLPGYKNVIWAESHDTYMNPNDSSYSAGISQDIIDMSYALMAARNDANLLYFTRPSGTIGVPNSAHHWNSNIVKAANKFHDDFLEAGEGYFSVDRTSVYERYDSERNGVVLVNRGTTAQQITFAHIANGTYTDLITGSSYTVSNSKLNVPSKTILILEK